MKRKAITGVCIKFEITYLKDMFCFGKRCRDCPEFMSFKEMRELKNLKGDKK